MTGDGLENLARELIDQHRREARQPDRRDNYNFPEPNWPEPLSLDATPGIVGDILAALMPHTEADKAALLFQFLTAFGNVVGAGPHYLVESDSHRARLFVVLVGVTAKGRKGTSWGRILALLRAIEENWATRRVASGLSSGEGLIYAVRDPVDGDDNKPGDAGETDKRLLAISAEFAGVLRIMARTGNSLSSVIRDAWDRDTLRTLTKNAPMLATGAHISMVGHVTADELRRYLDATETANGFANRFLFVCVKRSKLLPDGGANIDWQPFVDRLREIVETARSLGRLQMDSGARALWHVRYEELSDAKPGLLGAVLARAEAQVIRLSLIFALLDQAPAIGAAHLKAALACWRYCEQSARFVFEGLLGDPIADSIMAALRAAPDGLSRTQISDVFGRNVRASDLARGLQALQRAGLARPEERQTDGRPATIWRTIPPNDLTKKTN